MVSWVLDTNVIVKWFLEEEGSDRAEKYLNALTDGTGRVLVPSSVFYEIANVFWVRRRDALEEEKATRLWAEVEELPLEVTDWTELLPQGISFAYQNEVSPYDAVFVVLAEEHGCDLITADHPLWQRVHEECPWVKEL